MTDAQFTAILAVMGAMGTAFIGILKWGITRIVKAMDDSTSERVKHTEALIVVREKVHYIHDWVERRIEREDQAQAQEDPDPGPGPYIKTPRSTPIVRVRRKPTDNEE